jgi:hypothetical protein
MIHKKHQLTKEEVLFVVRNWDTMTTEEMATTLNLPGKSYVVSIASAIRKAGYKLARKASDNNPNTFNNVIKATLIENGLVTLTPEQLAGLK